MILPMGLFAGLSEDITNFFRDFLWAIVKMEIWCVQSLINALVNGVLGFGILDNTWIKDGYTACITLMFIVLPVKIIYEIIFAMARDDENGMDISKKLFGCITCVLLAISLSTIVPLANNLSINVSKALIGQQYSQGTNNNWNNQNGTQINNSSSAITSSSQKDLSKELIVSTLCAFGGMERTNKIFSYVTDGNGKSMDIGAERFYEYVTNPDDALKGFDGEPSEDWGVRSSNSFFSKGIYNRWSFYYRWDTNGGTVTDGTDDWDLLGSYENDSEYKETTGVSSAYGKNSVPYSKDQADKAYEYICEHSGEYIWEFGYIGTILGLAIFMILLFTITIEVAMRIIMIGFLYIIGPLCCMSLTNYQNPQAFTVWKNTILGMFMVNVTQIFMLQFLMNIASDIAKAGTGNSNIIASIALYFGTFSAIISLPKYIQSMIGGYGQGIMESLQQLRGSMGAAWGMTGGLVSGAGKKVMGRHNDNTGHLTGGIRGKIFGNKNWTGENVGGIANRARAIRGGLFGKVNNASQNETQSGKRNGSFANGYRNDESKSNRTNPNTNFQSREDANATASSNENMDSASNTNIVREGGFLGRHGVVNRTVNAVNNPGQTVKNMYRGMGNIIGTRGSGPKYWDFKKNTNTNNSKNENNKKK
ncbi:conjugal transfer protein TrbL family protein [Thomasclavelia cocleata]|jgi:hypothetical protein|uniref:conjugal transfer protein TrbL family protein n=1 Tax=Thomasclavelia cocleata TaxID=69824 RepID=UPI002430BA16|nr:conjugal transfer protein TrbL family protein [Thomasclavelia cocleata]